MPKNISLLEQTLRELFGLRFRKVRVLRKRKKRKVIPIQKRLEAKALVESRLHYFNQFYQFSYNKVFIKNQRTRWGSCSSNRNLNFNYRIIELAPELQDYLIVHELCHLKEFNHGAAFWNLIAQQIPEYEKLRVLLRHID